jgi:hypothetical protein
VLTASAGVIANQLKPHGMETLSDANVSASGKATPALASGCHTTQSLWRRPQPISGDTLRSTKTAQKGPTPPFEPFQPARAPLCWSANRGLLAEANPIGRGAPRRCDEHYHSSVCWSLVARCPRQCFQRRAGSPTKMSEAGYCVSQSPRADSPIVPPQMSASSSEQPRRPRGWAVRILWFCPVTAARPKGATPTSRCSLLVQGKVHRAARCPPKRP